MAHEEDHGKSPAELADRVWELAKKLQFALYTTFDGKRMSQWPLTANAERDEHAFTFLVGKDDEKYGHLGQYPAVVLGFADASSNKYVVINGTAEISNDRAKIKKAKDLAQAKELISISLDDNSDDWEDALADARNRGPKWRKNIDASLRAIGFDQRQGRFGL